MKHFFPVFFRNVGLLLPCLLLMGLVSQAQTPGTIFSVAGTAASLPVGWSLNNQSGSTIIQQATESWLLEAGTTDNVLTSSYNLATYSTVSFTADITGSGGGTFQPLKVEVSTDGGSTFPQTLTTTAPSNNGQFVTVTVSGVNVSATTVLRFSNAGASGRNLRVKNLLLRGYNISLSSLAAGPFCVSSGAGTALSVPFTTVGTFIGSNVFSAQLSDPGGATFPGTPVVIGTLAATGGGTISATIPAGTSSGSYRVRVVASGPVATSAASASLLPVYLATTNEVTSLAAEAGDTQATLNWLNPAACLSDVLVVGRAGTPVTAVPALSAYGANAAFGTGADLGGGQFAVYQGSGQQVTVTGLTNGTIYYFTVFVRQSGTIYSTGTSVSVVPTAGPALATLLLPQVLAGHLVGATTHTSRVPFAFLVTLSGLTPSATYHYFPGAVVATDAATDNGAGRGIFAYDGSTFVRSSSTPNLTTVGDYGSFTASASGTFKGWFILEPNGDTRFDAGKLVQMRLNLNDGAGGTTVATRLTTSATARATLFGSTATEGTALTGTTLATTPARQFVAVYDNTAGSGRPLAVTYVENDGTANNTANGYAGFYVNTVDAQAARWGTLVPNNNSAGVRRVELRDRLTGDVINCAATSANGTWPSQLVTTSPTGGLTPLVLTNLDAPLSCARFVGFNPPIQSATEGNTGNKTVPLRITMTTAPSANVQLQVTNASGGTATQFVDYLFSNQNVTFTTAGVYPRTLTVNTTFVGDGAVEPNETFNLSLATMSALATVVNTPGTMTILDDDFISEGLIINEFSRGEAGTEQAFLELLVTGQPGTYQDIRGWVVDDDNGIFSNNLSGNVTAGHLRFNESCTWERIPVGSFIVLYNASDPNPVVSPADPTDRDLDFVYIVPVETAATCGNAVAYGVDYLVGDCAAPSAGSSPYADATSNPSWSTISFADADAVQVRRPATTGNQPAFWHGLSFSPTVTDVTLANHPDFATQGANALFFSDAVQQYAFEATVSSDPRNRQNWTTSVVDINGTNETPGGANSLANGQYLNSVRPPLTPATTNTAYACEVRADETRHFINSSANLILSLTNASTDAGSAPTGLGTVSTQLFAGANSRNTQLNGQPYLMGKEFRVTPAVVPANPAYTITFYLTDAEISNFASYLTAQTGNPVDATTVKNNLRIYKGAGSTLVSAQNDDSQVLFNAPVVGTFGTGVTSFTATFSSFSTFALGTVIEPPLPVELVRFTATAAGAGVQLTWATASERNAERFEVQRSADGRSFQTFTTQDAHGTTTQFNSYAAFDATPVRPLSYYRLRQVDRDGKVNLSQVVTIRLRGDAPVVALSSYPQPFAEELTLRLTSPAPTTATVRLIDLQGRIVLTQTLPVDGGTAALRVPTAALASGTYVAQVTLASGEVVRQKVVKQ